MGGFGITPHAVCLLKSEQPQLVNRPHTLYRESVEERVIHSLVRRCQMQHS